MVSLLEFRHYRHYFFLTRIHIVQNTNIQLRDTDGLYMVERWQIVHLRASIQQNFFSVTGWQQ